MNVAPKKVRISNSPDETISLGRRFSHILKKGDAVSLEGNLGGGKTTFVKGILKGFGYQGRVLSPSFTLVRQYHLKGINLYHIDLYRIEGEDLFSFGLEDYLDDDQAITLIEWGRKIETILLRYIKVEFLFLKEFSRKLIFSCCGQERNLFSFAEDIFGEGE